MIKSPGNLKNRCLCSLERALGKDVILNQPVKNCCTISIVHLSLNVIAKIPSLEDMKVLSIPSTKVPRANQNKILPKFTLRNQAVY